MPKLTFRSFFDHIADMDKATNVIEDIVKNKGLIQSNNHKISNHIVMKCSGNESWTILSETFQ